VNKKIKPTKIEYFALLSMILLIIYMLSGLMGAMMEDKIFNFLALLTILLSFIGIKNRNQNKKENEK